MGKKTDHLVCFTVQVATPHADYMKDLVAGLATKSGIDHSLLGELLVMLTQEDVILTIVERALWDMSVSEIHALISEWLESNSDLT